MVDPIAQEVYLKTDYSHDEWKMAEAADAFGECYSYRVRRLLTVASVSPVHLHNLIDIEMLRGWSWTATREHSRHPNWDGVATQSNWSTRSVSRCHAGA